MTAGITDYGVSRVAFGLGHYHGFGHYHGLLLMP